MNVKNIIALSVSHLAVGAFGFALGIYMLPILIAPAAPTDAKISEVSAQAQFSGTFKKDLKDSDTFHWGDGTVSVGSDYISLMGQLAPGPDYQLYLSPEFVETEAEFNRLKSSMTHVGPVKTFENFSVAVPQGVQVSNYTTVIVWCETFGEFITSAQYR